MTLTKTNVGTHEDGRLKIQYNSDKPVLYVGAYRGMLNGVPVFEDVVECESEARAHELSHHLGLFYEENGHPAHDKDEPYTHLCTDKCGKGKRDDSDPYQALALVRAQAQVNAVQTKLHSWEVGRQFGLDMGDMPEPEMALAGVAAENAALNGLDGTGTTNVIPDVSLHTATPGTTGASENANSGSYARQACSWNAGSAGAKTNSTSLTFATLGTIAVSFFGTWSSATYGAGNWALGGALTSSVTAASITIAAGAITLSIT